MPAPSAELGMALRTTIALAAVGRVNSTYSPVASSSTAERPEAFARVVGQIVVRRQARAGSCVRRQLGLDARVGHDRAAPPTPTEIEGVVCLLVSATVPAASAVAVAGFEPFTAVHVPTVTFTVAPAAIAGVLALLIVVDPMTMRVAVPAATLVVPRLFTATTKETALPASGFGGLVVNAQHLQASGR